jgi:hypothetical protein
VDDQNVTLVFDRGIISAENTEEVKSSGLKSISAMDNKQIPACGVDPKPFAVLTTDIDTDDANDISVPVPKEFKP